MKKDYYQYFLYRHIRLDTNQVFYIGRGKAFCRPTRYDPLKRSISYAERYYRAFDKQTRSNEWKMIAGAAKRILLRVFIGDMLKLVIN